MPAGGRASSSALPLPDQWGALPCTEPDGAPAPAPNCVSGCGKDYHKYGVVGCRPAFGEVRSSAPTPLQSAGTITRLDDRFHKTHHIVSLFRWPYGYGIAFIISLTCLSCHQIQMACSTEGTINSSPFNRNTMQRHSLLSSLLMVMGMCLLLSFQVQTTAQKLMDIEQ